MLNPATSVRPSLAVSNVGGRRVPLVVLDDPFCSLDKEVAREVPGGVG